jgi:hypothetical protein
MRWYTGIVYNRYGIFQEGAREMSIYCVGCAIVFGILLGRVIHKPDLETSLWMWVIWPLLSWVAVGMFLTDCLYAIEDNQDRGEVER